MKPHGRCQHCGRVVQLTYGRTLFLHRTDPTRWDGNRYIIAGDRCPGGMTRNWEAVEAPAVKVFE